MKSLSLLLSVLIVCGEACAPNESKGALPQRIVYVGKPGSDRARDFVAFLEGHFAQVEAADRDRFDPASADSADVVILDWSQSDAHPDGRYPYPHPSGGLRSPLGPRDAWHKPTVLIGSAGHLLAACWQVHGGMGCTCLEPFAYAPCDHPVADGPIAVDRSRTTRRDVPADWKRRLEAKDIEVLPLAKDASRKYPYGFCTYVESLAGSPEVEVICGGVNAKSPTAAAIWRQGQLLHFGFDLSPAEMNERGQALLVNAVAYIARFTEDRPIALTPSPFAGPAPESRARVDRILQREDQDPAQWLKHFVAPSMLAAADPGDRAAYRAWYAGVRDYVHADGEGKLEIDEEARAYGVPPHTAAFLERAIADLRRSDRSGSTARRLLARYAPDGPGAEASADAWAAWWTKERPYLFFSDFGGYRWYLDPLSRSRGIPSSRLRGPARASR